MTLRIIHVGLGGWGGDWARRAIPPVPGIEVAALVDPAEPTLRSVQQDLGLAENQAFPSLTAALAAVSADAVVITAPAVTHVPLALEALEAGKHVLVEKPFANTAEEAATAVRRAADLGLIIQVSQNYRTYPAPRITQRLLQEGVLGELAAISIDFRRWDNDLPFEDNPHYRFPHPLINDMAIHHLDLLRMITGQEAVRVYTKVMDPSFSKYVEEASAVMTIEMADGLVVSYRGSWLSRGEPTPWAGVWRITGEHGELSFTSRDGTAQDPAAADVVSVHRHGMERETVELPAQDFYDRSAGLEIFRDAIRDGSVPETAGAANLGSLALMEAAARSAASGQVEEVRIP
ncbi:Gfo/Idh/MocA family protein [Brachybacterium sp. J153]|uniref:Gfo/Idh/MocA family protein n=1 Tax=Brachybacterium sp. J153 TaxID=3116488 RepID=UPI002E76185A|nr:Gfo/Idh/MocA family oxidoreductase [Brachybacterium sp. J153]MEE1617660.1 Gfo/Idh/MocA family oxidoreductase [Brachybacterium sp. J153]